MVQQLFTSHPKCPYVCIGPVVTRLCHGLSLQRELAREKSIASKRPFSDAHLNWSYAPKIGAVPRPPQGEPQQGQEPEGLPRAEMMFPRHTLERGEPSRVPNEDTSSEEEEAPNVEFANRGLMIEVEDLYRYRHFQDKDIVGWSDFIQFGVPPEESSDDEARDEQRELWGTIERLENRVNMLEHEVRRLTLDRYEEESDGSGE
nr:hypothetical protein Iba_chr15aCG15110 [Ipomoea batatas]